MTIVVAEPDAKSSYVPVPYVGDSKEPAVFKLRQTQPRRIQFAITQVTPGPLVIERCVGVFLCPGRAITQKDIQMLDVSNADRRAHKRTFAVDGVWEPSERDSIMLTTETPKGARIYVSFAVDLVLTGVTEPVRLAQECRVKIFKPSERFWNYGKAAPPVQYFMELTPMKTSAGLRLPYFEVTAMSRVAPDAPIIEYNRNAAVADARAAAAASTSASSSAAGAGAGAAAAAAARNAHHKRPHNRSNSVSSTGSKDDDAESSTSLLSVPSTDSRRSSSSDVVEATSSHSGSSTGFAPLPIASAAHSRQFAAASALGLALPDEEDDDAPVSGTGTVVETFSPEEWDEWAGLIARWDVLPRKQVQQLARNGVPDRLRGQVWQLLIGSNTDDLQDTFRFLTTKETPTESIIQWDIMRTFPAHETFKNAGSVGQEALYRLSKAYAAYDSETGYVQGLSFILGILVLHMPEEQAFAVIVKIMYDYGMRELFKPEMVALQVMFYQLERCIEEHMPELHAHFARHGVEPEMYASQWFLTLYAAKFSLPLAFRIMDLFLAYGMETQLRVAMALLSLNQMDLLVGDFEHMMTFFRVALPKKYMSNPSELVTVAADFPLNAKKLKRFEREFYAKRASDEHDNDPINRLTKENERLLEVQRRLENENDVLAKELVTTRSQLTAKLDRMVDERLAAQQALSRLKGVHEASLQEGEETKTRLDTEVAQLKDLYRALSSEADEERSRSQREIEELKSLIRQVTERAEREVGNLRQKVATLEASLGSDNPVVIEFKHEHRANQLEKQVQATEVQLASVKVQLAEAVEASEAQKHRIAQLQHELIVLATPPSPVPGSSVSRQTSSGSGAAASEGSASSTAASAKAAMSSLMNNFMTKKAAWFSGPGDASQQQQQQQHQQHQQHQAHPLQPQQQQQRSATQQPPLSPSPAAK
ncbi:rabgap1 protein [Capsaspora owczarzaki ATCC 30864]|uniref:Rabgap1 protein n=1 Tax=Capsaspora owczarzaki (strain ATCC 30864) TaxID=595528 RepID=A0A0D2UMW6_CAPO3|nr:rabgap1 protein [Capsaspora owczarzaki ATCC 30864]KJE96386.1 rabgap1 protein [Capsaspora owczarzaki ATCC 30864]|eukprot:XP_004344340.1 rabgap1 protein [Capsaspora owczarzaki ATCC 30864]